MIKIDNYKNNVNRVDNIERYLITKNVLRNILDILEKSDINTKTFIKTINSLADLIQYNNKSKYIELFSWLADVIVNIIEQFNTNSININNKVEELKKILYKLEQDFNSINVNIYFSGNDKYNILQKSINKDFKIINNIKKDGYLYEDLKDDQINILIVSEETINYNLDTSKYFDDVIYYDKTMNALFNISENIYYNNYDYYYLLKSLEKSESRDVENIVIGNSYPMTGIDVKLLDSKGISLALSSQDLYYSYKLAKLAISNNINIKRCIIGVGYYLLYHDLSKSKNKDAMHRVKNVYYPILKDKHNSDEVSDIEIFTIKKILKDDVIRYIFDLDFLDAYFKNLIYSHNNGYFNENFTRENNNMLGNIKLSSLCEEDKYKYGEIRANQHNKLFKYTDTLDEYKHIFNEFVDFLISNNVEPIIVLFPKTKYYRQYVDKRYENEFYKIMYEMKQRTKVSVIDLCKQDVFIEEDFIDFDHMSEIGAVKITKIINEYLNNR